ncbi:xanthine dehydrogenase subunit D [Micromonospora echinofusca]|uniref:Xanthine dehydrogenase subunit D n=2 Tax=Micromonospora echinofusca TaxID=47858 RepID=A0ABS3VIT1_MICEH|nr:xanthine dehydrogenase subunit D [Micromonospora echinofusca]
MGSSPRRPDGWAKVTGTFAFSSDLSMPGMLWGATVRSPHPRARIVGIDVSGALALEGVRAALTHLDVPGAPCYGLELRDQPVLAATEVRYEGEPVAVVAADDPDLARRAAEAVLVTYAPLTPIVDAEAAARGEGEAVHAGRPNLLRHVPVRRGDPNVEAPVVVTGEYEVGMQDQAFLGPESGVAYPADDGGVDLHVATQWLHVDRDQIASCLGLEPERVRLTLAGVGGAFGGREDISMQIHACLLALRTGRPVKMVYRREESFRGHVHRHPARLWYEHGATRDGRLVYVRARIVLDGGAYASSSMAVAANAATLGVGPYRVPNVRMDSYVVYTNNPPCGAMRGFGAVQACFGYESQMDRLAHACGLDPVELRRRNAMTTGDLMPTGQVVEGPAPVAELLRMVAERPAAPRTTAFGASGGHTTRGEGVVRGVGYGVGIKNVCFSEGFDDFSTARVRLELRDGRPVVTVHTAAAEVGQGLVTVQGQIARSELGVPDVVVAPADTAVGSAGSSSASRQTYVTGGAVQAACQAVRRQVEATTGEPYDPTALPRLLARTGAVEETVRWHHRPTKGLDPQTGQGDAHVQFAFAAHRATVEVDVELGTVRVVEIVTAQDVGRAVHPQAILGQIHGGTVQGLGLALMEEIQVTDGGIRNPSFTDYLIPTIMDVPQMRVELLELADPHSPYGLRGVGEPPAISSAPAVVAAVRAATGVELSRVPIRPHDVVWGAGR